jgi:hypothetical protein
MPNAELRGRGNDKRKPTKKNCRSKYAFQKPRGFARSLSSALFAFGRWGRATLTYWKSLFNIPKTGVYRSYIAIFDPKIIHIAFRLFLAKPMLPVRWLPTAVHDGRWGRPIYDVYIFKINVPEIGFLEPYIAIFCSKIIHIAVICFQLLTFQQ